MSRIFEGAPQIVTGKARSNIASALIILVAFGENILLNVAAGFLLADGAFHFVALKKRQLKC